MADTVAAEIAKPPAPRPVTPTTILARELAELHRDLENLPAVGGGLLERLCRARDLAAGLDSYLEANTTAESPALAELARLTRTHVWGGGLEQEMLSGHVEGQLLKFLVRMSSAVRVLEIGMFTGYSALAMAEALPEHGRVVACEIDSTTAELARTAFDHSGVGHRIHVEMGPALETLRRLDASARADAGAAFDFVFIDADKGGYRDYLDLLLDSALLRPGAIIAVDNTLMQGQPYVAGASLSSNGAAIAAFNRALAEDPRTEQVLIPLRDGLTLIRPVPR
ncbi:putative O-methyltransferase [Mycolicibacterium chubuense NBB4]|uniref:Putative O-methyltransferase n=1 Tax=Mycolicibacterium chubuense (strain NBB4) TaxID=710421 RepID=I4BCG9_MYCCN|nr:class I SAM-dependent methyltransferase [Mycolicibacterium chubuense]AFM14976.1 putative O-methyltransferase [Mycolicibacterium chubuense NBB4]